MMRVDRYLCLCALLLSSACGDSVTGPSRLSPGTWGGDHVRLVVFVAGGAVEFDCAHGRLDEPLVVDQSGRFAVAGVFVREHGGPIRVDEVEDARPARYAGTIDGQKMSLTVAILDGSPVLGPFTLVLNGTPRLVKCL